MNKRQFELFQVNEQKVEETKPEEIEKNEEPEAEKRDVPTISGSEPRASIDQMKEEVEEVKIEKVFSLDKFIISSQEQRPALLTPGITPNEMVEEITELTNPTSLDFEKRGKKKPSSKTSKSQKKKEEPKSLSLNS